MAFGTRYWVAFAVWAAITACCALAAPREPITCVAVAMLAFQPIAWAAEVRARRRRQQKATRRWTQQFCGACGYDVRRCRGVCSECGRPLRAVHVDRLRERFS